MVWAVTGMLVILIALINTAQMSMLACIGPLQWTRPSACYTKTPPQKSECAPAHTSIVNTSLRNMRIVGMACPYFFLGSVPSALEVGVLMVGALQICVPKPIPLKQLPMSAIEFTIESESMSPLGKMLADVRFLQVTTERHTVGCSICFNEEGNKGSLVY